MSEQGEVVTATPLIEMVDATLTSLADPRRVVAEDVSWAVMPGDYWVVGGLHGAGKSDFIAAAGGILLSGLQRIGLGHRISSTWM